MRLSTLLLMLLVGHCPICLSDSSSSPVIMLQSENCLKYLDKDKVSYLVINVKSTFGASLIERFMSQDAIAPVTLFDKPFVLTGPQLVSASGIDARVFHEDGSLNETWGEQHVFSSFSELKIILDDVQERCKSEDIFLVLSIQSFQRLSMSTSLRLCESTWRGSMAFVHRRKWAILATTTLAVVGGVWWYNYRSGDDTAYTRDDVSVNSGSNGIYER